MGHHCIATQHHACFILPPFIPLDFLLFPVPFTRCLPPSAVCLIPYEGALWVCLSPPGLHCCDRAEATHCQEACRRILRTMSTEHEIMEGLIEQCGSQPLPQEPMWQCFLGSAHPPSPPEEETPHPAKMDCAKLHCCSKANTSLCRYGSVAVSTFMSDTLQWSTGWGNVCPCFNPDCAVLWQGHVSGDQY